MNSAENTVLERAASDAALVSVRRLWEGTDPAINPNAQLKTLGDHELGWIVGGSIAHWICQRSMQVTKTRIDVERLICSMEGKPEPWEAGTVLAALPALGEFVAERKLVDLPIGAWSREAIIEFAWACFQAVDTARTARDETPSDPPFDPNFDLTMGA